MKRDERPMSPEAEQLLARVQAKLPPAPPPSRWARVRMTVHALFTDPSIDRRPLWYLLIRIAITILIGIFLFGVGGQVGFVIALVLFVIGVGVSFRIRRF